MVLFTVLSCSSHSRSQESNQGLIQGKYVLHPPAQPLLSCSFYLLLPGIAPKDAHVRMRHVEPLPH